MRYAREFVTCCVCGVTLAIGERCNCEQPLGTVPKDGLRAVCPYFDHRSSYRGLYYINCQRRDVEKVKGLYPDCDARDKHYCNYCCVDYEGCAFYQSLKGRS